MVEQKVSHDLVDSSCPVSVDLAVFTLAGRELSVLLRRRTEPPYPGFWALPGGLRCPGSSLDSQARALQVGITGVDVVVPGRDPRGDVLSVAYLAIVPVAAAEACAGEKDGVEQDWHPVRRLPVEMAFDHREVVDYAVRRLRSKVGYSSVGFQLLPSQFTISELQHVYEAVLGLSIKATSGAGSSTAA